VQYYTNRSVQNTRQVKQQHSQTVNLRKAELLPPVEMMVVQVADNGHRLLEGFFYCVTAGPSDALVDGNICMGGQRAGNGPTHTCTSLLRSNLI